MERKIETLTELTCELEGLLLVAQSRGDALPYYVLKLINKKADKIAQLANSLADVGADAEETDETDHAQADFTGSDSTATFNQAIDWIGQQPEDEPAETPDEEDDDDDYEEEEDAGDEEEDEEEDDDEEDDNTPDGDSGPDLRKSFSLSDRFRFRRELFANNDVEMTDTLNLVQSMSSLAEAEEFFYGDLEWDKDSPDVADFMTVVKGYFNSRQQQN